jgi:putative thioredoxin
VADFMSRASLAGAVDLSGLKKSDPIAQSASQHSTASNSTGASAEAGPAIKVPDVMALGTEANLKSFVTISGTVPVLIDFFASDLESSKLLSEKLIGLVRSLNGKMFLLRVDTQASLSVAQAFGVKEVPSVVALIKGQPIPLFEGDQTADTIQTVLNRFLEVASENGANGTLEVSNEFAEPQVQELPPKHKAAYDAIDAGDYEAAVRHYEAALNENPADSMAVAGLAQSRLLIRTKNINFEEVLASAPDGLDAVLIKADACLAVGHVAEGYQAILTRFAAADKDEREKLRKHLLELFSISTPDAPELAAARRALAALLY